MFNHTNSEIILISNNIMEKGVALLPKQVCQEGDLSITPDRCKTLVFCKHSEKYILTKCPHRSRTTTGISEMSVVVFLCELDADGTYCVTGDQFPGSRSVKSFLPSSYCGMRRSTSSSQALSSMPRALQVASREYTTAALWAASSSPQNR